MYVCQSVSWLTSLLLIDKYKDMSSLGWYIFSEICQRHALDVGTLFPNNSESLYVCQSVNWLASLLKLSKYRDISSSGGDIFLIFSGDIPRIFLDYVKIISNFLYFCQSVCLLTSLPKLDKGISPDLDEISFWNFWKTLLNIGSK